MLRTRAALAALLAVVSLSLAALQTPAPRPIAIAELTPAAYRQEQPHAAWTGENFVAVWADQRRTAYWRYGFLPAIYASRVNADGTVVDRLGIELAPHGSNPRIASNERGALVTYMDGKSTAFAVPLDRDARPSGPAVPIADLDVMDIASNGVTYAVVGHRWPSTNRALILNAAGKVIHTFDIEGIPSAVAAIDGRYIVISARGLEILATTVVANRPTSTRQIALMERGQSVAAAIAGENRVLVSWLTMEEDRHHYSYQLVDPDGHPVGAQRLASTEPNFGYQAVLPSLAWDGDLFLLAWPVSEFRQAALRIREDGLPLRTPFELDARIGAFAAASNGNGALLVSIEPALDQYSTDVYSRAVPSFLQLPELPGANIVALTARPQMDPAVAYGNGIALAVAVEGDGPDSIVTSVFAPRGGRPPVSRMLAHEEIRVEKEGASAGVAGDTFLVAWREMANFKTKIVAQRVGTNGEPKGSRLLLAHEDIFVYFGETSVASDGESFLVVWDSPTKEILGRRISASGTFLDAAPFVISRNPDRSARELANPEVLWTGSEYLVAWTEHEPYFTAPPAGMTRIRGARITADGTLIDAAESKTFFERSGHSSGLDLASNENGLLLVASFQSYIIPSLKYVEALPLDHAANATLSAPLRLDQNPAEAKIISPAAAGVGDEFFVFWGEEVGLTGRVRGVRLDAANTIERIDVPETNAFRPAATTNGTDILLVQSQHDRPRTNVVRMFTSTFSPEEAAAGRRQRSTRP